MILNEIIPSHAFAVWLMEHINSLFGHIGIRHNDTIDQIVYVAVVVLVGFGIGVLLRKIVIFIVRKIVKMRNSAIAREVLERHLLLHCSHVIPPLVILALIPLALNHSTLSVWIMKLLIVYSIITMCVAICAVLAFIWSRYDQHENKNNLPLKGILNTVQGIVWLVGGIIAISILLGKSPTALLAGLGAFAAALMLIFKDSILGFTAGIQLALNDMVHVGDWIVVPSTPANGIVMDVSLTAVKVQNFDNTIITLPPYTLVSTSFQNWRGMTDSGCRRICRDVVFEFSSVKPLTPDMLRQILEAHPELQEFADKSTDKPVFDPGMTAVNGTVDTNLGLFRAYMCRYILSHSQFSQSSQVLVRTLQPTQAGIPLQIYCFTSTPAWTAYEAIQSALFEHIAVTAPTFGLTIFNLSSAADTETVRLASAGS